MDSRPSSTPTSASDEVEEQKRHEVRQLDRRRRSPTMLEKSQMCSIQKAFVSYTSSLTTTGITESLLPPLPVSDDDTTTSSSRGSTEGSPGSEHYSRRKLSSSSHARAATTSEYPPLPLSSKSSETTSPEQADGTPETSREFPSLDKSSRRSELHGAEWATLSKLVGNVKKASIEGDSEALANSIESLSFWGRNQIEENLYLKERAKDTQTTNASLVVENVFLKTVNQLHHPTSGAQREESNGSGGAQSLMQRTKWA
eukprot:gb/GECG01006996.1/.p1 GENE.gb/GECG01006996.1/~~gb/GECG01006996.1/.p1  ORF type:complete len:257 (+),score=32.16 gb/GECG01006996.1/:1-771(+)